LHGRDDGRAPTSDSFGAWAEFYLSPLAGFFVRFAYWAGVVFALGTEITAVTVYMRFWFPSVPGWLWILGFTLLLVLVNAFNVKLFGAVEYGFSTLKISAIVAFLILGVWVNYSSSHGASANYGTPIGFE
jgi:amino acid transporter, AAT family